jgi:nucleophosmin 1
MKYSSKLNASVASSSGTHLVTDRGKEFFWGCELTKAKPSVTWSFEEEDDDLDYMEHTLFLRQAILGGNVKAGERHVVEIETLNCAGEKIVQPIISMVAGKADMCQLNLNFGHEVPATFKLIEGSGPIYLSALHVVQFPAEDVLGAAETETEDEDEIETAKAKKRKANGVNKGTKKRGKFDAKAVLDDDDDDEDDDKEDSLGESDDEDNGNSNKQDDDSKDEQEESMEEEDEENDDDDDDDYMEKPQKKGKNVKKKAPKSVKAGKTTPKPAKKVAKRKMTK